MKKMLEFLKTNMLIVKWTIWYFFIIWFILKFIFNFDMFSYNYWWKFFHATLHGFGGLVFGLLIYTAIPIYIATVLIIYRTQKPIMAIPFIDKIIDKIFAKKNESKPTESATQNDEPESEENQGQEFPDDLPPELRIPFTRAKNKMSLIGVTSVYNQQPTIKKQESNEPINTQNEAMPIPTDFDISDSLNDMNDSVPTFHDINFDAPIATEIELKNNTTKYFDKKHIEYETYHDFVATEKYLIYEHNDEDFWIMDGDSWFAAGKQKDSPINELIELSKQNKLTPIIYMASQNIMDIDNTISNFESKGIHVIKDLDELN